MGDTLHTNDTIQAVEASFRSLLRDKRYKSITVKDICERAHVSRQSFYVNFRDKEDVVAYIFKRDVVDPFRRINEIFTREQTYAMMQTIQTRIYQPIYDDREYYRDLVNSMWAVDDTFIRVATRAIYDLNKEVYKTHGILKDEVEADYVAYFYASSQAMLVQKWIHDGFPLSVERLTKIYWELTSGFWHNVMS